MKNDEKAETTVEVIEDGRTVGDWRTAADWAKTATLNEALAMLDAVRETIARHAAEIDPADRAELEAATPAGFKPYPVIVDHAGHVFDPASGWVVNVNVFTDAELRRDLARENHMGDVLERYGARWLSYELADQTDKPEPQDAEIRDGALWCPHCGARDLIVEIDQAERENDVSVLDTETVVVEQENATWETLRYECKGCRGEVDLPYEVTHP